MWRRHENIVCVNSGIYSAMVEGENRQWIELGRCVCSAGVVVIVLLCS